jgi:hypothetical protein
VRARKTHPDKADSSLTYWLTLSEAEVMRLSFSCNLELGSFFYEEEEE